MNIITINHQSSPLRMSCKRWINRPPVISDSQLAKRLEKSIECKQQLGPKRPMMDPMMHDTARATGVGGGSYMQLCGHRDDLWFHTNDGHRLKLSNQFKYSCSWLVFLFFLHSDLSPIHRLSKICFGLCKHALIKVPLPPTLMKNVIYQKEGQY